METLRVEVKRSLAELASLRDELNALNLASRRPCPFSTFEYLSTFVTHDEYGSNEDKLLFLAAMEGPRLVGYLPLRRERDAHFGIGFDRVGVLVSHDTDRPHVVARTEDEPRCCTAFYRHLVEKERGWALVELAMQDAESGLCLPPPVPASRFLVRRFENMPNTTVPLRHASFAEYFESLDRSHRRNVSRLGRRLLSAGHVEVLSCTDPRGRQTMLDLYLNLERRSWKQAAEAGISRSPRRVAFFQKLCEPEHPFELGFDLVLLDGLPVAGMVSGAFAEQLFGLEMAFDSDHDDLAPGHLLSLMSIRRALQSGHRSLNFNGNYSYYKAKLGGVVTPTSAVQIYRVGSIPWLKAVAGDLKRFLRPSMAEQGRFNPDRRRVSQTEGANDADGQHPRPTPLRPQRTEEREKTRASLRALEEQGVRFARLSGSSLREVLPFGTSKEAA